MSVLIDRIVRENINQGVQVCLKNKKGEDGWFIGKPMDLDTIYKFFFRVRDAWRILTHKAYAYHYKEDEIKHKFYKDRV